MLDVTLFAKAYSWLDLVKNIGLWHGIGIVLAVCGTIFLWRFFAGKD